METLRPSYKVKKKVLTKANISNIVKDSKKRQTRTGVVNAIAKQLQAGKHFEAPLSINRRDGVDRMFDGHHRILAIEKYMSLYPSAKIEVTLHVYDSLTDAQERAEYTIVNKGTKQSTNDVVMQYSDEILAYRMMTKGWRKGGRKHTFSCNITPYPGVNSMSFYRIVGAYMAVKAQNFTGGWTGSSFEFVAAAQRLGSDDVIEMNAFMLDFQSAFGNVGNKNMFTKGTPFTSVMKLWFDNRATMNNATMIRLFKKLVGDPTAMLVSKPGGMGAVKVAHETFANLLNGGRRSNLFAKTNSFGFV